MSRALIIFTHPRHQALLEEIALRHKKRIERFLVVAINPGGKLIHLNLSLSDSVEAMDPSAVKLSLSDLELSKIATKIIAGMLAQVKNSSAWGFQNHKGVDLIKACDNDLYTYSYKQLLSATESLLSVIDFFKPEMLIALGSKELAFDLPERPDIGTLYDNETTYCPLIRAIAKHLDLKLKIHRTLGGLRTALFPSLRAVLMRSYKFATILQRVIRDRSSRRILSNALTKDRPRIAVIIRGESEYWTVHPLIQKIREQGQYEVIVLQDDILKDPSARAILERVDEEFIPIHSLITPWSFVNQFLLGIEMSCRFARAISMLDFTLRDKNNGATHEQILRSAPDFSRQVLTSISKRFSEEIIFIQELSKFIESYTPDLLVTMSMVDNWGALIRAVGDQNGIKTLAIQNAALSFLQLPNMIFAHKFAVASQRQREGMIALGADPEKIVVTGQPQYDLYLNGSPEKAAIRQSFRVSLDSKLVLITTQPTRHDENEILVKTALEAVSDRKDVVSIVKLHPRERSEAYDGLRAWIRERALQAEIVHSRDVIELIGASDLMISRFSTTIQSALMVGTPVIAYLAKEYQGFKTDYLETPAVLKTANLNELKNLIAKCLDEPAMNEQYLKRRKEYLVATVGVADGKACERILSLIEEMIDRKGLNLDGASA